MTGRSVTKERLPHPLSVTAAACFTAAIAFAGVRELGVDAVMLIDTAPAATAGLGDSSPASAIDEPVARGVPAATELSVTDEPQSELATPLPPPATPAPVSPPASFGDLLGDVKRGAALPDDADPRARPIGLSTSVFDVQGVQIRAVGIEPDGQLEIPDETEIGWFQYGSTAGQPGATVLAAHVSWNGTTGPFFHLDMLEPGSSVDVTLDDGTTQSYVVIERTMYEKDQLPSERIWRNTGPETLVLITCGGDFNPEIRRFQQNIVVYAVPTG